MLIKLKNEIPQFLYLLSKRELSTRKESRMWFRPDLLVTDALRRIITHNWGKVENEMFTIISELMQIQEIEEYQFSVNDMFDMVKRNAIADTMIFGDLISMVNELNSFARVNIIKRRPMPISTLIEEDVYNPKMSITVPSKLA